MLNVSPRKYHCEVTGRSKRMPVYATIHVDFLDAKTLIHYDVPYEYDRYDPNYLIVLREMDKYETEVLFNHTRQLRVGKLPPQQVPKGRKDNEEYYRKRNKSAGRVQRFRVADWRLLFNGLGLKTSFTGKRSERVMDWAGKLMKISRDMSYRLFQNDHSRVMTERCK